jgi:hypothetical protein
MSNEAASKLAALRWANASEEEKKEHGRRMVQARWEKATAKQRQQVG